jgi:uncharacterized iron-regulated membrane protein
MSFNATLSAPDQKARLAIQRRSLLWRIHLWAALIASPFIIGAILTGILYVFTPQIEGVLHGRLDKVTPAGQAYMLDELIETAIKSAPSGWRLHSVVPAYTELDSAKVAFVPPAAARNMGSAARPQAHHSEHDASGAIATQGNKLSGGHGSHGANGDHAGTGISTPPENTKRSGRFLPGSFGLPKNSVVVYVDPYRNVTLGSLAEAERFNVWARKLHSTYLVDGLRWTIEFAASWTLVMLVTGVFLWRPDANTRSAKNQTLKGRAKWRHWHAWSGVMFSLITAAILVTGLTWSRNAGQQVKLVRDVIGQQSPRIPAHFKSTTPDDFPASGATPANAPQSKILSWNSAWEAVRLNAPDVAVQLNAPVGRDGFWRANHIDRGDPTKRFDLLLDAYNGKPLFYSGWSDQPWFGKATAIGIPFHRGEFGLWNQILLGVFGFGLLFSFISGWTIYLKRRRQGVLGMPPLVPGAWTSASPLAYLGGALMLLAMPLLALSAVGVLAVEVLFFLKARKSAH